MPKTQQHYSRHRDAKHGVAQNVTSADKGSAVVASSPLHLGFIPGSEGSGRVAATLRSGTFIEMNTTEAGSSVEDYTQNLTLPTVAVLHWTPMLTALNSDGERVVVSTAMFRYYNEIRAKNASLSAYSPISVFFALCGVTGLVTLLSMIRIRLQVLSTAGSQVNGAFPHGLMAALHLSQSDRDNLNSYISSYNQLVKLSEGLIMPKSFKLFARQARLGGTVFLDDPMLDKSQLIILEPNAIWYWDVEATSPTVGKLIYKEVRNDPPSLPFSINGMLNLASSIIQNYTLDQDMNNIYAEIRKAFTDAEVYKIAPFPLEGEGLSVEFEQLLLDEIRNARLAGKFVSSGTYHPDGIEEDVSTGVPQYIEGDSHLLIKSKKNINTTGFDAGHYVPDKYFVYTHENQPGEEAIADLVAFKWSAGYDIAGDRMGSCGTEIITDVTVTCQSDDAGTFNDFYYGLINELDFTGEPAFEHDARKFAFMLRVYQSFSCLPIIDFMFICGDSPDPTKRVCFAVVGDVDNRFPITSDAMWQIHKASAAFLISM